MTELCELTRSLWHTYLVDRFPDGYDSAVHLFSPDCVIIGTGRHEYYENLDSFIKATMKEFDETKGIRFKILDEWYREFPLTPEFSMVYGGIHVRNVEDGSENGIFPNNAFIDMDTRFSMLFKKIEGEWKIMHVHQSMPYPEQKNGEFYPKTLTEQVEAALSLTSEMQKKLRLDPLTGLLHNRSFYEQGEMLLKKSVSCWCFMMDLNHFKRINDTYGHITGDSVIQTAASVLKKEEDHFTITGRLGGDEFGLIRINAERNDISSFAEYLVKEISQKIQTALSENTGNYGISIGITAVGPMESVQDAFRRADELLYQAKKDMEKGFMIG